MDHIRQQYLLCELKAAFSCLCARLHQERITLDDVDKFVRALEHDTHYTLELVVSNDEQKEIVAGLWMIIRKRWQTQAGWTLETAQLLCSRVGHMLSEGKVTTHGLLGLCQLSKSQFETLRSEYHSEEDELVFV